MRALPMCFLIVLTLFAAFGCKKKDHSRGADLAFTSGPTISPATPTSSDPITVTFTITNVGPNASAATNWAFSIEDDLFTTGPIPALASHASTVGSVTMTNVAQGTHHLSVVIDPDHHVGDDNRSNNVASLALQVAPAPPVLDLSFAPRLSVSPSSPTTTSCVVSFGIHNSSASGAAANQVHWHIYSDGAYVGSSTIPTVPANGTVMQSYNLAGTSGGTAGTHTISIVVDPNHVIAQSDTTNDTASTTITVMPTAGG